MTYKNLILAINLDTSHDRGPVGRDTHQKDSAHAMFIVDSSIQVPGNAPLPIPLLKHISKFLAGLFV
jgi:hypothetical protein